VCCWDSQTSRKPLLLCLQEGGFELQLIDLAAQRAADAAFATAIAASSAMAATAERTQAPHNSRATGMATGTAARPNSSSGRTVTPPSSGQAAAVSAASAADEDAASSTLLYAAAAAAGFAAAAGSGLGDLPTLAQHGVLASVRVKDGKALGTLGYERELRRQRHASVLRRVSYIFSLAGLGW
jgi:hypothetical protein